ncbi:hypothetical protein L593_01490 [Salinarchaeum sp. Harcht-Bsk1]|uniref:DUF7508 domain-containing protein n=1 Tax=Salinarchaeum sp. Harcht-Bsk1 TaxID=1333523 RepID=UPI0003423472|nr:hypothetical protein [Salinarchaeum sp. Harcht-Bsk1]AGN00251.1 hypothetical protein L593_01490 [Salinarchaeum sp. Harcht-Bsk1]
MPLRKAWNDLTRTTVGKAPERYGVYEVGDADGEVLEVGAGVLKDELKEALAYGAGEQVRWEPTPSLERAEELAAEHRERI